MDFSESYQCSLLPTYSPDGLLLATAVEYRLAIREVETLKVVQLYSCLDKVHSIEWSPDSRYVLCGLYDRSVIQVWSAEDPDWTCKIDEGPAGIKHTCWLPDGTSVLLVADFCIRMTVWSLVERRCGYLPGPKFASKGIVTGQQSDLLVVLEVGACQGPQAPGLTRGNTSSSVRHSSCRGSLAECTTSSRCTPQPEMPSTCTAAGHAHLSMDARPCTCLPNPTRFAHMCHSLLPTNHHLLATPLMCHPPGTVHSHPPCPAPWLPQRKDCKDWISVYSCSSTAGQPPPSSTSQQTAWTQRRHFQVTTMDAANIALTPDESLVAVADTCLAYKVLVYGLDGALVGTYSAYGDALGVRCVSWSPDSQLLAVGSYDQVSGVPGIKSRGCERMARM